MLIVILKSPLAGEKNRTRVIALALTLALFQVVPPVHNHTIYFYILRWSTLRYGYIAHLLRKQNKGI